MRVYVGVDAVTGKKHHLTEIIPAGPRADKLAEKARTRLLAQVDEHRNPRTRSTVNQMLDQHAEMLNVEATTLDSYNRPPLKLRPSRRRHGAIWIGGCSPGLP